MHNAWHGLILIMLMSCALPPYLILLLIPVFPPYYAVRILGILRHKPCVMQYDAYPLQCEPSRLTSP
jgi:hypothetical protein